MSDGSSKPNFSESIQTAVIEPIKDELGKMVEAGIQSVTGGGASQDPQEDAKRQAEDAKKKQNVMRFIEQMKADEQRLKQQRIEENQKKQAEAQAEAEQNQVKQFDVQKKQANTQVLEKQRSMEAGKGKGVGG